MVSWFFVEPRTKNTELRSFRLEKLAGNGCLDDFLQSVVVVFRVGKDLFHGEVVGVTDRSSQGVAEQFFGEALQEELLLVEQGRFEVLQRLEPLAVGQVAADVELRVVRLAAHSFAVLMSSPLADGVVVLQREAEWIDAAVAARAILRLAMLIEPGSDREILSLDRRQVTGVRRRRRDGAVPKRVSSTHVARRTGSVRVPSARYVRIPDIPSTPPRWPSVGMVTRRNCSPSTPSMP